MNKKFSTLVAGLALLSAISVNAQQKGKTYSELYSGLAKSVAVDKLKTSDTGLYQLSNKNGSATDRDSVLYIDSETQRLKMVPAPINADSLANTLWCVKIAANAEQGQTYKYEFTNKGTGLLLDVSMDDIKGNVANTIASGQDTAVVGGDVAGWAFAPRYSDALSQDNFIYSYFSKDSVVGLAMNVTAGNEAGIFLVKEAADKALKQDANSILTKFTLKKAAEIVLNATQINTLFGQQDADKGVALSFEPDVAGVTKKNPFADADAKFMAEQVKGTAIGDSANYVYIYKADSSYLKVDTALVNKTGTKFLDYAWTPLDVTKRKAYNEPQDSLNKSALKAQYQFLFTYKPSVDSLNIYVHYAAFQTKNDVKQSWTAAADTIGVSNAHVSIQDLVDGDNIRILTVDSVAQNTHIKLNYKGCAAVVSDKKSRENGVYVIYNSKDQVLASPIHKNGTAFEWVTLDAQDPQHMPAYQWIVTKTQSGESLKETSPLKLINREYTISGSNPVVQLREKDGKLVVDGFTVGGFNVAAGTAVRFEQIKDSTILKDPYLGYKKFDKDSLTIAQYKFNYLHKFEKNSWIKRGEGKDSVLYAIKGDYTAFTITEGNVDQTYAPAVPNVDGLKGVAQLKRTQYLISLKADTVGVGAEERIVLGQVQKDSVYFKENNHFDGNHYYAMLEADAASNAISTTKFSVSDAGVSAYMQSQPLEEATTSAFAISVDDVPLYRRFNTSLENAVAGQEDSTKILKFKEYYRGEYLMDENNPKFQNEGVDYLGIERADKATGLSFYVDTAILHSTQAGYIKPQYFIYLNPEIQPAVKPEPCPLQHNHGVDADGNPLDAYHCSHAEPGKPGYMKAQYLVSFADSVSRPAAKADELYKFGEYTRVGFVDGLRMGDSLYILTNGFEKLALADLDTAKIKAAYKAAKIEFNIIDLKAERTDAHHNYTWSFRFVNPEKAANLVEEDRIFLIESDKKDNDKDIAPSYGAWLKSQNGCLVLSDKATSEFDNTKTGGDNALIFNIENGSKDDMATDNEEMSTSEVKVIAQNGAVRITNAEGKKVVIINILGQTVANTVITSNDATIAASKGVVVVTVEGEDAVKAIVD